MKRSGAVNVSIAHFMNLRFFVIVFGLLVLLAHLESLLMEAQASPPGFLEFFFQGIG